MNKTTRTGYMCRVDFMWELGEVNDSTPIYASVEDLKRQRTCWKQCGIVKVEIKVKKEVVPEDFSSLVKK